MYFQGLDNVAQVKAVYRTLAKQHHPDLGGDTATMQRLNAAYHAKLEALDGQISQGSDGREHKYYYRQDVEQAVMDKIQELLGLQLPGCLVELVGVWVWVSGDTKPNKEALKSAGLIFHGKRQMWYWRQYRGRRHYTGKDFDTIRAAYGSRTFEADDQAKTVAA